MAHPSLRDPEVVQAAFKHLHKVDPLSSAVIHKHGALTIKFERNHFKSLVRAIIAQQISGKAATSIYKRLLEQLPDHKVDAAAISKLTETQLRTAGVSPQKMSYLQDLARKIDAKEVRLTRMARMSDEDVIADLTQVKGIGVWTAQMFLIFSLGRPDVFPHADLGIRQGLQRLHQLPEPPKHPEIHQLAEPWRPYASVASWYLWRSGV